MNDAIAEMNSLVERCLYVGKIEEGVIVTNTSRIDVGEALRERLLAAGAADRVHASIASDLVINTDPQLIGIVFANLIDNARKYSAPGSPIRIAATHQPDGGVAVEVSNQPRLGRWPDAAALFTKYYRAASSRNVIGSGLGLFLSQRLAEHLGGGIAYEPTDTEVRFRLWLPG
jgi:signal transduction histidine kinase